MTQAALLPFEPVPCPDTLEARFWAFHAANPKVYAKLREYALAARKDGDGRVGMKALFERLRWWVRVETQSTDGFKLNNNHTAFYARLLQDREPVLRGMFETRASVADGKG